MDEAAHQAIVDEEHLRLLRIGWLISAATNLFWVFFPLIYVGMGLMFAFAPLGGRHGQDAPPRAVGLFFVAIGIGVCVVMAALTTLKFLAARAIGARASRTLVMVVAAISCLGVPWGTALGVLTLVALTKPSIAARFNTSETPLSNSG